MKKFLVSMFLGVSCLPLYMDIQGMKQAEGEQNQRNILDPRHMLYDVNTLMKLLSEIAYEREKAAKELGSFKNEGGTISQENLDVVLSVIDQHNKLDLKRRIKENQLSLDDIYELKRLLYKSGEAYDQLMKKFRRILISKIFRSKTNYPHQVFCNAVAMCDFALVERLLKNKYPGYGPIDINQADGQGVTPLMYAAHTGNTKMVSLLSKYGDLGYKITEDYKDGKKQQKREAIPQKNNAGQTLMYYANGFDMIKYLWEAKYITSEDLSQPYDSFGHTLLVNACRGENIDKIRFLLKAEVDVNQADRDGMTPLMCAAKKGNIKIINLLGEFGAGFTRDKKRIPQIDRAGNSLVQYAMQAGFETIRCLLNAGYITNEDLSQPCDSYGNTLLIDACNHENVDLIRFLLEAKVNVNQTNNNGETPLMRAASSGSTEILELLKTHGAGFTENKSLIPQKTKEGETLVYYAMLGGIDVIRYLQNAGYITNGDLNQPCNASGDTSLIIACDRADINVVRFLLDANVDVNQANKVGQTPLMYAAQKGNKEVLELLKSHSAGFTKDGSLIPQKDSNGRTLVNYARGFDTIQYLWEAEYITNEDLSLPYNTSGNTLLINACYKGDIDAVRFLLNANVDVNQADECGVTPLMYAVQNGNKEILKLFKTHNIGFTKDGQCIPQEDDEGNTLVYYALKYGVDKARAENYSYLHDMYNYYDYDNVDIYDQWNSDEYDEENVHITKPGINMVKYLYKNDFITKDDLNSPYHDGETLLINACTEDGTDLLEFLLNVNKNEDGSYSLPNVNSPSNGKYPLIEAILKDNSAIVELLLKDQKIDVNLKYEKTYLLFYAIQYSKPDITQFLLQHKNIRLDITSDDGYTPLQMASRYDRFWCIKSLLEMPEIKIDETNSDGNTALHIAARNNSTHAAITLLLRAGADINAVNKQGNTPILEAIDKYKWTDGDLSLELMSTLNCFTQYYNSKGLSLPSKKEIQDKLSSVINGGKAIFRVVQLGSPEMMSTFFDLFPNVDVNVKSKVGKIKMTPLHFAVYHGYIKGLKFLLKAPNINLNEIESRGNTALHIAVWKHDIDAITLLLEAGADVNVKDAYGDTPILKVVHDCCVYNRGRVDTVIPMLKCFIKHYNEKGLPLPSKDTIRNMTSSQATVNIKEGLKQEILDLFPAE